MQKKIFPMIKKVNTFHSDVFENVSRMTVGNFLKKENIQEKLYKGIIDRSKYKLHCIL